MATVVLHFDFFFPPRFGVSIKMSVNRCVQFVSYASCWAPPYRINVLINYLLKRATADWMANRVVLKSLYIYSSQEN